MTTDDCKVADIVLNLPKSLSKTNESNHNNNNNSDVAKTTTQHNTTQHNPTQKSQEGANQYNQIE